MKYWSYIEPGDDGTVVTTRLSEDEIFEMYFPWWSEQMIRAGKADEISLQCCIDDFVCIHWCFETTNENIGNLPNE